MFTEHLLNARQSVSCFEKTLFLKDLHVTAGGGGGLICLCSVFLCISLLQALSLGIGHLFVSLFPRPLHVKYPLCICITNLIPSNQFFKFLLNKWAKHNSYLKKGSYAPQPLYNKVQQERRYCGRFDNVYIEEMTFRW